jgi:hypothetical protein
MMRVDVLAVALEEEILDGCPTCEVDKATTYEEAMKKLARHQV